MVKIATLTTEECLLRIEWQKVEGGTTYKRTFGPWYVGPPGGKHEELERVLTKKAREEVRKLRRSREVVGVELIKVTQTTTRKFDPIEVD